MRNRKRQAGDTLIEVTIALAILSMVLAGSTRLAIRAYQQAQTARERSTVVYVAQQQLEHLRYFRDNHTWDQFLYGNGSDYEGVLSVGSSACRAITNCFYMRSASVGGTTTMVPEDGAAISSVPDSYIEITASTDGSADPKTVKFTVSYGFRDLSGGPNNIGHVVTDLVSLERSSSVAVTPPSSECPIHSDVVMVLDASNSMVTHSWPPLPTRMAELMNVANAFVDNIELGPVNHLAIMSFSSGPHAITSGFVSTAAAGHAALSHMPPNGAGTHYLSALTMANNYFSGPTARAGAQKIIVFVSDGQPNDFGWDTEEQHNQARDAAIARAQTLQAADVTMYTVGINLDMPSNPALEGMAGPAGTGTYASAHSRHQLESIMAAIASTAVCH